MRAESAELKKRLEAIEAEKTALEREKLTEIERLRAESEDLKKFRDEAEKLRDVEGRYQSSLQRACETELLRIPEDKRAAIQALTDAVPVEMRLDAIQKATNALGVKPISGGSTTQPNGFMAPPQVPDAPKPLEPKDLRSMSFIDALKTSGWKPNTAPPQSALLDRIEALEKQISSA